MIHKTSIIETKNIGKNSNIWQYTIIQKNAAIGNNCNICSHCFIENNIKIGNNVTIKNGVYLWDGITIEDNVFIGPNTTFTNDLWPRSKQSPEKFTQTLIKKGSSIGANSTIIAGITIGENAMIGAGSVVTKSIPKNTLWFGNPAQLKGYICNCGEKLNQNPLTCPKCNSQFSKKDFIIE